MTTAIKLVSLFFVNLNGKTKSFPKRFVFLFHDFTFYKYSDCIIITIVIGANVDVDVGVEL